MTKMRHLLAPASCLLAFIAPVSSQAPPETTTDATIVVDRNQKFQTIDGFGFCEAFQRAHTIKNLPDAPQKEVLDLLFSQDKGAGFSIVRVGLGSSPNSTLDHMNSIAPNPPAGLSASSPLAYVWDRNDSNQVWIAQRAMDYGVDMFYADAWSAPGYMKTNGRDDQGGYLCGVTGAVCATGSWIKTYADYLVQYVKFYLSEGIPIRYLGFVNEPNLVKPYATMLSNGSQAAEVVVPLHASLAAANLSHIGITCCEGQGWSMQRDLTAELQAAGGEKYTGLVTTHAYKGDPDAPDRPLNTSLKVWITENSPIMKRLGMSGLWYQKDEENEGLHWANLLHNAFTTGNVSAYIYWIAAGGSSGEAPLIWIPRRTASTPATTPYYRFAANYFAFAHFSRVIRPGAVRLGLRSSLDTLQATAYLNANGSVAVQVINNANGTAALSLDVPRDAAARAVEVSSWLTDNGHNMTFVGKESPQGTTHKATIPGRSLVTFFFKYG